MITICIGKLPKTVKDRQRMLAAFPMAMEGARETACMNLG